MRGTKNIGTANNPKRKGIRTERKELIKRTRDKILNISRANETAGGECIVCGKEIKKNQAFRALPKDKNCKDVRLYHLKTCGPGSDNWKAFRANGNKPPQKAFVMHQLSFDWGVNR